MVKNVARSKQKNMQKKALQARKRSKPLKCMVITATKLQLIIVMHTKYGKIVL